MIYTIRHVANLEDSSDPRYKSYFAGYIEDEWVGGISHIDAKQLPSPPLRILVQEEMAKADTVTQACWKFRQWMYKGLDKSFLMS